MSTDDRAARLRRELFFRALSLAKPSVAVARALSNAIVDVTFEQGDVLFRRGDPPEGAYFIVDGEVALEAPDEETWRFHRGAVVGILDVNLERPRARTAMAESRVHAMFLRAEDWLEMLEDNFEYSTNARRTVAVDLHRLVVELAPSGGFEEVPPYDELDVVPELNAVARLVVLKNVAAFAQGSVQAVASLAAIARAVELGPGQTLFEAGGSDEALWVVASGIVELERREVPVVRASFGASTLVGGTASFGGVLQEYRAVAKTPCSVLTFTLTDLDDVAEDHFDLTRSITKALALERERVMRARSRARTSTAPPPPLEPPPRASAAESAPSGASRGG